MNRFNLVTGLKGLNGAVRGSLASLGGANSPELRAMGNVLAKSVRRTLSVSGGGAIARGAHGPDRGGHPSRPGEPPRAQTKQLSKSVKVGVVGTGLRVGALRFTSDFMESGVNATRGDRKNTRGTRFGLSRGRLVRKTRDLKKRTIIIARRPYLQPALDAVQGQMATEFANVAGASIGRR